MFHIFKKLLETHRLTFQFDLGQALTQDGAVLCLAGADEGTERQIFLIQLQAAERLRIVGVTGDQIRSSRVGRMSSGITRS
jgi:hypothetical protein